jgi:hypothetical protein
MRAVVLVGLAGVLIWEVISRSLVTYLADAAPEAALRLHSSEPTALLNLADRSLKIDVAGGETVGAIISEQAAPDKAPAPQAASDRLPANFAFKGAKMSPSLDTAGGFRGSSELHEPSRPSDAAAEAREQIRVWTELALLNDPLNAHALRILGQLAADETAKDAFMLAATRRSLRESLAVYWLMQKGYERKDYAKAIYYADILLRTKPQVLPYVAPMLAQLAENKDASSAVKKLLANNPPWRAQFFSALPNSISDARTPLELLLSIQNTPTPPVSGDLHAYLNFLIGHNFYELAYYAWLQFLPPEQLSSVGLLFNGSFKFAPSGLPFDWVITPGQGVTVDIAARPESGQRALMIEFGYGRVEFQGVTQMIMLPPGAYEFKGNYKGEVVGRRGLDWRITCAGGNSPPLGKSPMVIGVMPVWKDFEFSFTVPSTDCRAQYVRLRLDARSASEQLVSGAIWYNELRIARAGHITQPQ